ncbi:MAG: lipoate--protein ligase family protein [Gemmatimonadales bacterium]
MAIDRALAERAGRDDMACYRIYRWDGNTVSFGANEAARRSWDRDALDQAGVQCVRRPTGGRGVWHDRGDLTYSVTAPAAALGGLHLAYRVIHEQLAAALGRLGLAASLAAPGMRRLTLQPGACFDLAVGGEVLVGDRKVIGSAQALLGPALLQHGAIARADRQPSLARFRLHDPGPVADPTSTELPAADIVAGTILALWRSTGAEPVPPELMTGIERDSVAYSAHFRDQAWTWRR